MEEKMIPYFVHEGMMVRQERTIKRLWILCIIMFLSLVLTNAGWIWYESQFEDVVTTTQEVEQDADDNSFNSFVGGDYYGSKTEDKNNDN